MPWRENTDPYHVMVSELMLQQTQVSRVMEKFPRFIERFPAIGQLAGASLADVLDEWIGLGYNRRAKFLKQAAEQVVERFGGTVPRGVDELESLPGIGPNTARAIAVYAFGQPHVFVETNIRAVIIHHFFRDAVAVSDREILAVVEACLDRQNPRQWFWAMMDYGTWLKKEHGNISRRSATYAKQSKFAGSNRQKRAAILRLIVERKLATIEEIRQGTGYEEHVIDLVLAALVAEGFVEQNNGHYVVAGT